MVIQMMMMMTTEMIDDHNDNNDASASLYCVLSVSKLVRQEPAPLWCDPHLQQMNAAALDWNLQKA